MKNFMIMSHMIMKSFRGYDMVRTHKVMIAFFLVLTVIAGFSITSAYAEDDGSILPKTSIRLVQDVSKGFTVKSEKYAAVDGFEVAYSTSNVFSPKTSKYVTGNKINKTITHLSANKNYYVKARTYRIVDGQKQYGEWSDTSKITVKSYYYSYTTEPFTKIYSKASSSSKSKSISYNTKVSVYSIKKTSKGNWLKVKYKSKYYYIWEAKGSKKLTTTRNNYCYDNAGNSNYQQAVVDLAVEIFKDWDTKYVSNGKGETVSGVHQFDCSGFADYVYNTVLQKDNPLYRLPHNIDKIDAFARAPMYNKNENGEFYSTIVCKGKLDYSKMQPGDLVCFKLTNAYNQDYHINHCGIYLGGRDFAHSTKSYGGVCIMPLSGIYSTQVVCVLRVIPAKMKPINNSLVLSSGIRIYKDEKCNSESDSVKLKAGSMITIKYTRDLKTDIYGNSSSVPKPICYVEYTNEYGVTDYGFVYDYKEKLNL